jgi:starch phosphorylase
MPHFKSFYIAPAIPPKLEFLKELAYNLWWTWNPDAISLFLRLDPELWEETNHNPVMLLSRISQDKLLQTEGNDAFLDSMHGVEREFRKYMENNSTWFKNHTVTPSNLLIAYFSAEYGITECLPLYSGGLGILAGDHLKSASEIGIPLVAVGILYQKGYFSQYLNPDGWQQESYPVADYGFLPIVQEKNEDGAPLVLPLEFKNCTVHLAVWRVDVGRIRLYLLDTNIKQNAQQDQDLTDYLYGGDDEMRLCQEFILGIGGMRALSALGHEPTVYHMNEGHSAFLALERIRRLREERGLSFQEAREVVATSSVFTTHTPVPAGSDYFKPELVKRYFGGYTQKLGISMDELLGLGRKNPSDAKEHFCMTVLALKLSCYHNAVARLHEETSRRLWHGVWPELLREETPITHVTNGICSKAWVSNEFKELYDRYLGPRWPDTPEDPNRWKRVDNIPNEELWRTHERRRERLVAFARARLQNQMRRQNAAQRDIEAVSEILNPKALTIGFARRFASYKRANMIFSDRERLARILSDGERPVQIIFAGKAHPRDEHGKEIIRSIIHMCREEPFNRRVVFVEDYDMNVSRYLVQGCDVWLNNPRRPLEASGTSGMKAAINGVLNFSVMDGWWDEAYGPDLGWSIGQGETYEDEEYADLVESRYLYNVLEKEIIPLFYDRGADLIPRGWIEKMKSAIRELGPVFNTGRMVREYTERFYLEADLRSFHMIKDEFQGARALAAWKDRIRKHWGGVQITGVETDLGSREIRVGESMEVSVRVRYPAELDVKDVCVEIVYGPLGISDMIKRLHKVKAGFVDHPEEHVALFRGRIKSVDSGRHGFAVRAIPSHEHVAALSEFSLMTWA